jgi:hypothetical protein
MTKNEAAENEAWLAIDKYEAEHTNEQKLTDYVADFGPTGLHGIIKEAAGRTIKFSYPDLTESNKVVYTFK